MPESLTRRPPYSSQQNAEAAASIASPSPYAGRYNANHADVLRSLSGSNAAKFALQSGAANADYGLAYQNAENELALAGLRNTFQQQQNDQSLRNQRLQNMYGFASSLLGGLFE